VRVLWPRDVQRFLRSKNLPFDEKPPLHPDCRTHKDALAITRPEANEDVVLVPGLDAAGQEVPLEAQGRGTLTFFVDGVMAGASTSGEPVWWTPTVGVHIVSVVDQQGGHATQALTVRN
jgi:hypothetical protein